MSVKVQNRLEILRGGKIIVPGCEPTSAFTSTTLAENRNCTASVVDLKDALEAIPEATIVSWRNPRTRFFVLPDGPPPSPDRCTECDVQTDWYQILRDIGEPIAVDNVFNQSGKNIISVGQICEGFPLKGVF